MLQLQIDRVEVSDLAANIANMAIREAPHPPMRGAQQILVQVKYGHIEDVGQLPFQAAGIARDAAQVVVGRDQGEARTAGAVGCAIR